MYKRQRQETTVAGLVTTACHKRGCNRQGVRQVVAGLLQSGVLLPSAEPEADGVVTLSPLFQGQQVALSGQLSLELARSRQRLHIPVEKLTRYELRALLLAAGWSVRAARVPPSVSSRSMAAVGVAPSLNRA